MKALAPKFTTYMKPIPHLISTCLLMAISAPGLHGATLFQTQPFNLQDGDLNLAFNGFNTALGTLQSVYIELDYTRSGGYLAADNEGATAGTVTLTHITNFAADGDAEVLDWSRLGGGTRLLAQSLNRTTTTNTNAIGADDDPGTSDFNSSGADYYRYNLATVSKSSTGYFSNVAQFEDKQPFTVPVTADQPNTITIGGALNQAYSPATLAGAMKITYTYEAVPEVPSASLAAIALGGLLLRRRRNDTTV